MDDPNTHVVGVLADEDIAQLNVVEGELRRLVMIHTALTGHKTMLMQNIVLRHGESLENDYSIDPTKGLLLRHGKPEVVTPPELELVEEKVPVEIGRRNGKS